MTNEDLEQIAMAIYWAAYDGTYGFHKTGSCENPAITKSREQAWKMASDKQREFCRYQALAAVREIARIKGASI